MTRKALGFALAALLLGGCCASSPEDKLMHALYDNFDTHCREHARQMAAEADEDTRYRECMNYFITYDTDCPYCTINLKKSE
jgi:hypothetical protein